MFFWHRNYSSIVSSLEATALWNFPFCLSVDRQLEFIGGCVVWFAHTFHADAIHRCRRVLLLTGTQWSPYLHSGHIETARRCRPWVPIPLTYLYCLIRIKHQQRSPSQRH